MDIRIEEWSVVRGGDAETAPEARPRYLHGKVYGHPIKKDGTNIVSSEVVTLSVEEKTCLTKNTIYRLGTPDPEYAKQYLDGKPVA
jgi:hypothetical protein